MTKGSRGAKLSTGGTYQSKLEANKKYEQKVKQITIRVPAQVKEKLDEYVRESPKYSSLNGMVLELLEKETGLDLRTIE